MHLDICADCYPRAYIFLETPMFHVEPIEKKFHGIFPFIRTRFHLWRSVKAK